MRRRRQIVSRRANTAPKTAPGKNPATTALLGNAGHDVVDVRELVVFCEAEIDGDGTGVKVAAVVDFGIPVVAEPVFMVVEVFLSRTQVLFAEQV